MPGTIYIKPDDLRAAAILKHREVPLNQYQKTMRDVRGEFPAADLINIYRDMRLIREFETMLQSIRHSKSYNGIEYTYTGPAHLYIGQEAAAVGQAYALDADDHIFGNHRSHGEVIAKGMSAIRKLDESRLYQIMSGFKGGATLRNVEKFSKTSSDVRTLAADFLLYGFMAELFGREAGFTGGLGNSMHVFFAPFGIYPNNAIVGASAGIGAGAALYKKLSRKGGVVVVNLGDGALSTGHVWEAINFATMRQYGELWDEPYKNGLPVIFNFMNNFYAMSGRTNGETMGYGILARVGAAFNDDGLHCERIDGYNPFAVIDAFRRKKETVLSGGGPVMLDTITYRQCGHSATDQIAYRSKDESDLWVERDSIAAYKDDLIKEGYCSKAELDGIEKGIADRIANILGYAIDLEFSPRMDFSKNPDSVARYMFSNGYEKKLGGGQPEVIGEKSENSRAKAIGAKLRFGLDPDGKPLSADIAYTYRDAIFESLLDKFYADPTMILFGEDVREHGNSFGVLQGLYESVPRHRLFNAPIAEGSIISAAVGYALCGGRAVPEIMWCDFLGRCADELFNQLAKWQGMSAGILKMPCVVRVSVGAYYGAQHSQDWSGMCTQIPGLKVVYPASPYDAKGLLNSALCATDPIMFFESQKLFNIGERFEKGGVPTDYYEVPIGKCDVKRKGNDITILTIGPSLYHALEAAAELKGKWNLEAEVIDARTLIPFDYGTVLESVKKTGRIVIVGDACERGGYVKTLSSNVTELAFRHLKSPPAALGSHNWVTPCQELERFFFPQKDCILGAIHERIMPLKGYVPAFDMTPCEKLRLETMGI